MTFKIEISSNENIVSVKILGIGSSALDIKAMDLVAKWINFNEFESEFELYLNEYSFYLHAIKESKTWETTSLKRRMVTISTALNKAYKKTKEIS